MPSKNVHARAGGAEVGVGTPVPTDEEGRPIELPVAIAQAATAAAPYVDGPNYTPVVDLDGALNPIANAQVLQSTPSKGRSAAESVAVAT